MGRIIAVCISKEEIDKVYLQEGVGIEGDAHAGDSELQVSLLGVESVAKEQEKCEYTIQNGAYSENILTEGIILKDLQVGTKLKVGEAEVEVMQIGKECTESESDHYSEDCIMHKEGIFVKVTKSGYVRADDTLKIKFDFGF